MPELPSWPGWERRTITLQTFLGPTTADALVCCHLAVHRGVFGYGGRSWALTHIPSGCAIAHGLPCADDAHRVAEAAQVSGVDWSQPLNWFTAHATDPAYLAAIAPVRRAWQQVWHGDGAGEVS